MRAEGLGRSLVLYAAGVYVVVWRSLLAEVDQRLHDDVDNVEQLVTRTSEGGIRWRPIVQGGREERHEEAEAEGALMPARSSARRSCSRQRHRS